MLVAEDAERVGQHRHIQAVFRQRFIAGVAHQPPPVDIAHPENHRKKAAQTTPPFLIPGVNDGEEFRTMMEYLSRYKNLRQIHILPFHQIGSNKYTLTDREYEMEEFKECTVENAQTCAKVAEEYGFEVNIGGWDVEKWQ